MTTTAWRAPVASALDAILFDLDALTDVESDGHRPAFNAAFAAHGLDFGWTPTRYRQLLALGEERQRISAELRKRGVAVESDVLMRLLADEIHQTKIQIFEERISDAALEPRPGLLDFVVDAVAGGALLGVVTTGRRSWSEPLVRRLFGDGLVTSLITTDDVPAAAPHGNPFAYGLADLDTSPATAMAIVGSAAGLRAATAAGLTTVVVTGDGTPRLRAAAAVRPDYEGPDPLRLAGCQRLHDDWRAANAPAAVA